MCSSVGLLGLLVDRAAEAVLGGLEVVTHCHAIRKLLVGGPYTQAGELALIHMVISGL